MTGSRGPGGKGWVSGGWCGGPVLLTGGAQGVWVPREVSSQPVQSRARRRGGRRLWPTAPRLSPRAIPGHADQADPWGLCLGSQKPGQASSLLNQRLSALLCGLVAPGLRWAGAVRGGSDQPEQRTHQLQKPLSLLRDKGHCALSQIKGKPPFRAPHLSQEPPDGPALLALGGGHGDPPTSARL